MLRVGMVGTPPYFTIKGQEIDGVDVKLLNLLAEKKNFQPNIIIPKTFIASGDAVCIRASLYNAICPIDFDFTKTIPLRPGSVKPMWP